jgi:hypothetical protein
VPSGIAGTGESAQEMIRRSTDARVSAGLTGWAWAQVQALLLQLLLRGQEPGMT